ncbi:MAG: hypothetical protein H6559_24750 [Lewinellaceae bacterium]|nr:hypothetical protein [Lewinellaceae bacterium]
MDKKAIFQELNKVKGIRESDWRCIQRHREIKGHALGENAYLPAAKPEVPEEIAVGVNELSKPPRLDVRSCLWHDVKGHPPLQKTPARPAAASVYQYIAGWWTNTGTW